MCPQDTGHTVCCHGRKRSVQDRMVHTAGATGQSAHSKCFARLCMRRRAHVIACCGGATRECLLPGVASVLDNCLSMTMLPPTSPAPSADLNRPGRHGTQRPATVSGQHRSYPCVMHAPCLWTLPHAQEDTCAASFEVAYRWMLQLYSFAANAYLS